MKNTTNAAPSPVYLIYARVSPKGSQWSAQETSIKIQLHECKEYIRQRVDPMAKFEEVYDEFHSGKNLNRPGIQQIIADINSGNPSFTTLVVWQLDRLSRNLADAAPLFKLLRDAGLGFISIRQSYLSATGAMARFNLTQTIAIAQLEREMTSERIAAKMHWIASQGKVPWGTLPLGYRRRKDMKNTVEIVPEDADLVKKIFATYISCCAQHNFSPMTAIWQAHKDKISDPRQFYRILRNRFYIGSIMYKGEELRGEHQPIIGRDDFDTVQTLLPGKKYNIPRPGRQKYAYLLAGLVRCHCDPKRYMTPKSVMQKGKRYFYYKCTVSSCDSWINAEKLDTAVLDAIKKVALDPAYVRECYDYHQLQIAQLKNRQEPRLLELREELVKVGEELKKIDHLFLTGVVNPANADYWNEKLTIVRCQKEKVESEYNNLLAQMTSLTDQAKFSAVLKSLSSWAELLENAADDVTLKRNLILSTVSRVRCVGRGKFEVELILDTGSGKRKIEIASCADVMPNGGKWRRSGE